MRDTLYFDADCGFCTRCAEWLAARGRGLDVVALQAASLGVVDAARAEREVPFRHADGRTSWGGAAIAAALRTCPQPWRAAGAALDLPGVRDVARLAYAVVARHRHRLPGGTAACRLPVSPDPAAAPAAPRREP